MHQKNSGREAFCRHKLAGIRALAPEAVAELNDGHMDLYHLDCRQSLLEALEKIVVGMSENQRLAFGERVLVYRGWSVEELRSRADKAAELDNSGVDYEAFQDVVKHAQSWVMDTPDGDGKRAGYVLAKRFLELAYFHVERQPRLRLVASTRVEPSKEASGTPSTRTKLRVVR